MSTKEQMKLSTKGPFYNTAGDITMSSDVDKESADLDRDSRSSEKVVEVQEPNSIHFEPEKPEDASCLSKFTQRFEQSKSRASKVAETRKFKQFLEIAAFVLAGGYVLAAAILNFDDAKPVITIYCAALTFLVYKYSSKLFEILIQKSLVENT